LNVLKEKRVYQGKAVMEHMIDLMTPAGPWARAPAQRPGAARSATAQGVGAGNHPVP
jgi:hypothetical protein